MNTQNNATEANCKQNISLPNAFLLNDENLYNLCKTYGERARLWRQKFAGLLPEVFKRRLYEKKGFSSIFEFSKRLAGMSEEQVRLVLNLEKRFEKTPVLKSLLVDGKVSVNKLARIVSIAKPDNEIFLATQVQILSKSAVETLVRDEKFAEKSNEKNKAENVNCENRNGLQKSFLTQGLPGQTHESGLKLDEDVEKELMKMQEKGIDINKFLRNALKTRKENIENEKLAIAEAQRLEQEERDLIGVPPKEYMSVKIKKIIHEEHGTKCSVPGCTRPAKTLHHTGRFALTKNHDPHFIAPLCEEHHEIAHKIDLKYMQIAATAANS